MKMRLGSLTTLELRRWYIELATEEWSVVWDPSLTYGLQVGRYGLGSDPNASTRMNTWLLRRNPTDSGLRYMLGNSLMHQGHWRRARRQWRLALRFAQSEYEVAVAREALAVYGPPCPREDVADRDNEDGGACPTS